MDNLNLLSVLKDNINNVDLLEGLNEKMFSKVDQTSVCAIEKFEVKKFLDSFYNNHFIGNFNNKKGNVVNKNTFSIVKNKLSSNMSKANYNKIIVNNLEKEMPLVCNINKVAKIIVLHLRFINLVNIIYDNLSKLKKVEEDLLILVCSLYRSLFTTTIMLMSPELVSQDEG